MKVMMHTDMVATTVMVVATATIPHIMQSMATQCHLSMVHQLQQQLKHQVRVRQPSKQHQLWQAMSSRLQTNLPLLLLLLRQQQEQQRRHLPLLLLLQMLQTLLNPHQLVTSSSSRKPQMLMMHSRSSSSLP
jgi:hypothetical protein